jgi:L-fuculose-phosphate aldolase
MPALATPADVLSVAKELHHRGLVEGTAGNVSARLDDSTVCVTPSSLSYEEMTLDDLVVVDLDGEVVDGHRSPTTEKALHLACYRRYPEVGGVIHSHPIYATMFALVHRPIPACIEEFVVYVGGEVPVADYTVTGTDELGEVAAANVEKVSATLLANHGMVTIGATPQKALHVAALVERTAQIVWGAEALGRVHSVPDKVNRDFAGVYDFIRHQQ